jgi:polyvinyl alcohol dehydrogenase (cytochrome)
MNPNARTIAAALAIVAALAGAACSRKPDDPRGTRVQSTNEFVQKGGDSIDPKTHPGGPIFEQHCATCHNGRVPKAPATVWLEMMAPDALLAAMNDGIMRQQAAALSADERRQVAEYLTRTSLDAYVAPKAPARCTGARAQFSGAPPARTGWGHDTSRFVPQSVSRLSREDVKNLKLKWAFAYPNAVRARSQPAIGWGAVFVGSQDGTVYAFDLETGCARWTVRKSAEVRTAIVADPETKRLYFGDVLGRAYAVDAFTGAVLWSTKLDDHANATATGSPTLGGGSVFFPVSSLEVTSAADPTYACCTFRGSVSALDPQTGAVKWKTYSIPEAPASYGKTDVGVDILGPSGAPVWGSPAYDAKRDRLYFGTGENYSSPADGNSDALFAVDAKTGAILWRRQLTAGDAWNVGCMMGNENCPKENGPDYDLSASPILASLDSGADILVVGQKSGMAYGIDPETGVVRWERRLGHGGTQGGIHFGMAAKGRAIFAPVVDMSDTRDARKYDAKQRGAGVHAVDASNGAVLWKKLANPAACAGRQFCDPGASAAATATEDAVFVGHLDGVMRAYDVRSGDILWSYDTTRPIKTITGDLASGGSMSGPGPAVAERRVVFNSGYGIYFHMPGNLLLVFEAPGD